MPVCSSDSRPRVDSLQPPQGFDPRLAELVDHLAVDLAHLFLGVPQPGVSGTDVSLSGPSKEV